MGFNSVNVRITQFFIGK